MLFSNFLIILIFMLIFILVVIDEPFISVQHKVIKSLIKTTDDPYKNIDNEPIQYSNIQLNNIQPNEIEKKKINGGDSFSNLTKCKVHNCGIYEFNNHCRVRC